MTGMSSKGMYDHYYKMSSTEIELLKEHLIRLKIVLENFPIETLEHSIRYADSLPASILDIGEFSLILNDDSDERELVEVFYKQRGHKEIPEKYENLMIDIANNSNAEFVKRFKHLHLINIL